MTRHLIVLAKAPLPGTAKTRLSPPLSPEQAAALAEAFLRDVLCLGEEVADVKRTLAYSPRGASGAMRRLAGRAWTLRLQVGRDLGERLADVLSHLLLDDRAAAVVIGSDSPHLAPERLRSAFDALRRGDLVLGPTDDGGYYLIGLRRWVPGLLDGVRWSTEHALSDTLARARAAGLSWALLPPDFDVDDADGLGRLAALLDHLPADRLPYTRRALAHGALGAGA